MKAHKKVLLVDDDLDLLELLVDRFGAEKDGENIVIVAVPEAQKALDALSKSEFSVIITDFFMPDMNGKTFTERVRQTGSQVPIILLSGYLDKDNMEAILSAGADLVLQKSSHITKVVRAAAIFAQSGKRPNWNDLV